MLALRKLFKRPKLSDGDPMVVFYYCDQAVTHQMEKLNHLMNNNPDNLDRRATLIHQLKESQHNLMNIIMTLMQQSIPGGRTPCHFRAKYPDDILLDQINGPIWFGAECIAAGSHIANHELESSELRPYAVELSKCIAKVRHALREQCFVNTVTFPQHLVDLMQHFDGLWAEFEFRYVSLMCNVKSEEQYYQQQDVVILFSETAIRALQKKYFTYDMVEMMDPIVMFAIPRLAIICGLVVHPDGPLDPSKSHKETPPCFRAFRQLLARIKELLGYLTEEQLSTLESALCSAEGLGTLERKKSKQLPQKTVTQAETTDSTSSPSSVTQETADNGPVATSYTPHHRSQSVNLDARNNNRTVFEPAPVRSTTAATTDQLQFPTLGVDQPVMNDMNDLPSSSSSSTSSLRPREHQLQDSNSSSSSSSGPLLSVTPGHLNVTDTSATPQEHRSHSSSVAVAPNSGTKTTGKKSPRARGPGGFASAEDLMHRLFVAISGVADQLQTNHARELRMILKQVFTLCLSEPEESFSPAKEEMGGEYPAINPCTPEPQSPLITSTAPTFSFTTSSLTIEDRPSWVPDGTSPSCFSCHERFSWRRRRHHCRNCGNVVCAQCSPNTLPLPKFGWHRDVRVCTSCYIQQLGQATRTILAQIQSVQEVQ